jgi:signal transduction histidine kinase
MRLKDTLARGLAEFNGALPKWAWFAALFSLVALLDAKPAFFWARFPDAVFSMYCLSWFGYATAINFNVRRRVLLAVLAFIVSLSYGLAQLAYATNSVVAHTVPPNIVTRFPLTWIQREIGKPLNNLVLKSNSATGRTVVPLEFLDNAIYVVLLPMKWALFLPPFFLYLLFILSTNDFRGTLSETARRRQDYLAVDGIVRAAGKSLAAEQVSLLIRIPGRVQKTFSNQEERVLPLIWRRGETVSGTSLQETRPVKAEPRVLKLMKHHDDEFDILESGKGRRKRTRLTVPISFHGGVIGILEANLLGYGRFNHTSLQKLKLLADLVAPSVQDFRSLAAADQIGSRLTRLQAGRRLDDLGAATSDVLRILHEVLSPVATGLFLEMGFIPLRKGCPEDHPLGALLEEQAINTTSGVDTTNIVSVNALDFRLESCPMFVRTADRVNDDDDAKGPVLGTLGLAIPAEKDVFSQPTLAAHFLNRKTVASLAADGILDLARNFFGLIIKDLGVSFSKETLPREEWFAAITTAIQRAQLLWIVAVNCESEGVSEEQIELISSFNEVRKDSLLKQELKSTSDLDRVDLGSVVCLNLRKSKHQLWIGVQRAEFGRELSFQSPWRIFLRDLAEVADSALHTLQEREVSEVQKLQTAQYQGVMTIAVTTGTLIHQLVNMIKDQLFAAESLQEALDDNDIKLEASDARLLGAMKRSAAQMQELTQAFKSVTKMEERKPCSLRDASEQAMKLFQVALLQRKIEGKILVQPDINVDLPFHVVAFALANLIGNAKEAIRSNGMIRIEAQDEGDSVLCHVTNSGPRISDEDREHLFKFGHSSKPGHNGWGLYFVAKSLQENRAGISLDTAHPETRFAIRLPKPGPE